MRPVAVSPAREIFQNEFLRLFSVVADFGERQKEYFVVDKGTRIGGLIVRNDEVLLVRQYRFLIDGNSWEIPGGGVERDENPEEALVRECREEAGIVCSAAAPIFTYRLGLDTTAAEVHLFRISTFSEVTLDAVETDAREWVSVPACLRRIRSGDIKDLMTIVALLLHTHPMFA